MKLTLTVFLTITLLITSKVFGQKLDFKTFFSEAHAFLKVENYTAALPILLEMEKMDEKNYNTLFSIGYCYMMSVYEKEKAIPYFERILTSYKNLTIDYLVDNPKLKKAPIETIKLIGEAYHFNYQFEEALEKYSEYKNILDPNNKEGIVEIDRLIKISNQGKRLVENPIQLKINGIGSLNTEHSEYRPKLNGEENILYFTSRRPSTTNSETDYDGKSFEDIYESYIDSSANWSSPKLIDSILNSPSHDACLYVSPDNSYMIVYRVNETTSAEGAIYETFKEGQEWSELKLITAEVNSRFWETDVNISANGQTMFFTSNRPGGMGGRDIWMMKKLPGGEWAKVQNIGNTVNSLYDEESPFIHPDGKTLYFSSKGHTTMGGFDIFKSELQSDGTWGVPENMGYPLNTTGDDVFFIPNLDGTKGYFSSYRKEGIGGQDIYELEFPKNTKRTLAIYKGKAKYNTGEIIKNLKISISDFKEVSEEMGIYRPNNITGRFLFILSPADTFKISYNIDNLTLVDTIIVPSNGGVFEIEKIITVINGKLTFVNEDKLAQEQSNNKVKVEIDKNSISNLSDIDLQNKLNAEETIILNNLLFVYDRATLLSYSKVDLQKLIKYMKSNPTTNIMLEGHTDNKGNDDYNIRLSKQRSDQVKKKLIAAGISTSRIQTMGYGESKPIVENELPDGSDNPDGRQLNRRVEIKILKATNN